MRKELRAAIDSLSGDAAMVFRALLAELQAEADALRGDVIDAVILQEMLVELAENMDRRNKLHVARVRVLARLLATAIARIDQNTRAFAEACYGGGA